MPIWRFKPWQDKSWRDGHCTYSCSILVAIVVCVFLFTLTNLSSLLLLFYRKTGWANQTATVPGVEVVTSTEFPDDATARIQNAHLILSQVSGGTPAVQAAATLQLQATNGIAAVSIPQVPTAPIPASPALPDAKIVGKADNPTKMLLIRNMFDKDEETDAGWAEDIRLDFVEESSKWGTVTQAIVMEKEPGGKIYASFDSILQAQTCASNLAGRWFDKRQLRVEFIKEMPQVSK